MHRTVCAVVTAALLAASVTLAGPVQAAPTETEFQIALVVDGAPPVAGDTVSFQATLATTDNEPLPDRTVTLLTRVAGSGDPFRTAATLVTDDEGRAATALKLVRNTAYRWHFAGAGADQPTSSNSLVQRLAAKVVPHVSDSTPAVNQTFAVTGRVYPTRAGRKVSLWSGTYQLGFGPPAYAKQIAAGTVRADGTFRLTSKLSSQGTRKLFVRADGDSQNLDGYSKYLVVKVG